MGVIGTGMAFLLELPLIIHKKMQTGVVVSDGPLTIAPFIGAAIKVGFPPPRDVVHNQCVNIYQYFTLCIGQER
jgi:hypothetical protein